MREPKIYIRILVNFVLTLVGVLLVFFLAPRLLRFFLPFVIAFCISSIANPFVRFMEKKIKIVRKGSAVIMIVLVLGGVIGILYLLISFLVKQIVTLYEERYEIFDSIKMVLDNFSSNLEGMYEKLPFEMQIDLGDFEASVIGWMESFLTGIQLPELSVVSSYIGSVVDVLLAAIITILASYFLTAERDNMAGKLKGMFPKPVLRYWDMITGSFTHAVGGYFKAQFKIMMILVLIMFVGFEIMDIGYSFLLAFGIAFLDFLPVLGTGVVFWPWILIDLVAGNYRQAIFLGVMYLVCQVVKQVLQPKMVGDSVGVNPLATLLYMYIGYRLGGIFGMIIGIPAGMIVVSLYQAGLFDQLIKGIKIIARDINEFRKY